ncbi:MAG: GTPase Era, partial [Candidatus Latescibacteria bacterium]|nr:GTPase Era [Candidatus Latescibacterota bacterium]
MTEDLLRTPEGFRSGYIVVAGRPNVGKSTLFNALVGERLAIITSKPQTTRNNILGILTTGSVQMLFLDTPGLLDPQYRLQQVMVDQAREALTDADVLLGVVDASDLERSFDEGVREAIRAEGIPLLVALNKADLVGGDQIEQASDFVRASIPAAEVLEVSARTGSGIPELRSALEAALPPGPLYYPEDTLTEQPERFFVAELVREEAFEQLRQEVPYAIATRIEEFREEGRKTYIRAEILVERPSQKGIVIGTGGKTLKSIGRRARHKIEDFLARPV